MAMRVGYMGPNSLRDGQSGSVRLAVEMSGIAESDSSHVTLAETNS